MTVAHVIVRTRTPWERMSFDDFCSQDRGMLTPMAAKEANTKGSMIRTWEEAYRRPFCAYRARVRDACQAALSAIPGVRLSVGVPANFPAWLRDGADEWIFPIDDDDTFEPSIARVASEGVGSLIIWERRSNYLGKDRIEAVGEYTDTCNYAIRKSFLATFADAAALTTLLFHWRAAGLIAEQLRLVPAYQTGGVPSLFQMAERQRQANVMPLLRHPSVTYLKETHSTYYIHTGSISFLVGGKMQSHTNTVEYLRSLPLHPLV